MPPTRRNFVYGGTVIGVESTDPDALAWLEEFLRPSFGFAESETPQFEVCFTLDAKAHAAAQHRAARAPMRREPCFALDSQVFDCAAFEDEEATVLRDTKLDCFYRVASDRIEVLAHPGSRRHRVGLMRVVREIASECARRRPGTVQLHAAALALGEHGIALAGAKNAGKTSLLVHGLEHHGVGLIANDRVFVELEDDHARVRGMPTIVSVRPRTLEMFASLPDRPASISRAHLRRGETPLPTETRGRPRPDGPLYLSPRELCDQLGVPAIEAAPLRTVALCEVDPGVESWTVERLTPAAACDAIGDCRFGVHHRRAGPTVFEAWIGGGDVGADEAKRIEVLAAAVPTVRLRLGPDAYRETALPDSVFGEILRATDERG